MKKIKIFSLGIAMLITFLNFGTTNHLNVATNYKTITGIVSDALGPIGGVNVLVKGTKNGTTTDFDGKYSIVANEGDILEFTYTGMKKLNLSIGKSNIVNAIMTEDILTASEVVVVGSTSIKKRTEEKTKGYVGNAILDDSAPAYYQNSNTAQSLSRKVSGLQVNSTSNVNSTTRIVLRGNRGISTNNQALVVIDNKITTAEELQKLAPEKIEETHVLKGAQGAALYGSQGVNGVIMVVTKDGLNKEDKAKFISDIKNIKKPLPVVVEPNNEDYELFIENQFTSPKSEPLSTFSIDVDNASYTNIRRFINQGQKVPKDAVRVEEMMNFFKYNYAQPSSKHPFAIHTEYSDCPWNEKHKLVKIGLQGKEIDSDVLPNSNFVFLIDVSGSMGSQNKLPLLKESMKVLVNQLREKDRVSIVVYAGAAGLVLPPTSGNDKETIIKSLENLNAGGSTAGGAGIELAYKIASENFIKGGNNRLILATDGDFNVGASSNKDMETLIEEKRKSGVFLTCLGYGMGNYKDSKMETLADKGNGNYAYIDNIQEANRFLGKEFKGSMFAIAKDVKIQIEFNPKHVQNYRLIGYENRKLRPEDFKNDAIDAGELGSGHTVTALYEIIPTGVESTFDNSIDPLKYTEQKTNPEKYSDELATVKFRYKKPDGDKSIEMVQVIENKSIALEKASEDFKFTTAVAWFGLKLRDSKLVNNKTSSDIKTLALQGKAIDKEGYKAEFIRLVEAVN
ncbi:YfbK domain-containing protein [Flavobacterium sp.]|jgi:Ca-activated chloride channel family protein|uniref:YfbK domain-containing protein n=1 Tax=Flavobacterium sp. TaxID=239 RepID=UPI002A8200FC|nr:von Willebrand factor type A domain-containing protein [Flavobacterium sp.]